MCSTLTTIVDRLCSNTVDVVWGFFARHAGYVRNLKDNLAELGTTLDSLRASKAEVMEKVLLEEQQQQKKRLPTVVQWLEKVDKAVAEGQKLIECGDREIQRLCLGGYCSTRCWSTSIFGKEVDVFLNQLGELVTKKFDQVTAEIPASYEQRLADVKTALENLTASKKQVMRRVLVEEQPRKKKRLDLVALWFERVDKAVAGGQEFVKSGDQELQTNSPIEVDEFLNQLRDLIKEKPKEFDQVTAEIPAEELVAELPCDPTVGLESKLEEVWSCLASNDAVGVYGIGGVGKTTLLTQVHNKFVDTRKDVFVIWVVVGKDTPPEKIQEKIGKKIGFPQDSQWGSEEVTQEIFNKLGGHKFVLFLDDIWKPVDLTKIGIPAQENLNGSKIIFSTRSSKVCDEMRAKGRVRVETLQWEDAWKLFRMYAGEDTISIDPEIPPLAESMAYKCDGLPIALKVVGRAMSGKLEPREWRHSTRILREPSQHFQGMEVVEIEVFEVLKFSYDSLPNDKWRSCFLYCALYPDDHLIEKDVLVDMWICEDFWENSGLTRDARDEAYSIIDTLIRSCLLEDEGSYVKMHDVIRDMALWLEKDNSMVMAGMQLKEAPRVEKWEGVERLSLMYNDIEELTQVPPCHKLVTLLLNNNRELQELNGDFFHFMGTLTVLDLSFTELKMLPKSIEKLISLQYLNISATAIEELPVELAALSKLMYLDIRFLDLKAKRSERVISGLLSVQVLKIGPSSYSYREEGGSTGKDDEDIRFLDLKAKRSERVISGWLSVQVLKIGPSSYSYREEGGSTGKDDEEMLLDELDSLEHLKELEITIKSVHNLGRLNPKLLTSITAIFLEDLEGTRSLNMCLLEDMRYLSTISIVLSDMEEIHYDADSDRVSISCLHLETVTSFRYVRNVTVARCNYLKDLTIMLLLLPNLTSLLVDGCDSMEEIISSKILSSLVEEAVDFSYPKLFSKLDELHLEGLSELRYIYQNPLPFPLLRHFTVKDCPLLKKLPLDSHSRDGPKINLKVEEEWWEAIEWKDDATKALLLPRFKCKFD